MQLDMRIVPIYFYIVVKFIDLLSIHLDVMCYYTHCEEIITVGC